MRLVAVIWAIACFLAAQSTETFDVASFKRIPPGTHRGGSVRNVTPTSLSIQNASLGNLLFWAYGYEHFRVVGPVWRDYPTDVIYDVIAKTSSPVRAAQMDSMLQTLLTERLALAFHREQRDVPVYALVLNRNGPKFQKSASVGEPSIKPCEGYFCQKFDRISMRDFAKTMGPPFTSRHVVDETDLPGLYDFTLDLSDYVLDAQTNKPILDGRGAIDEERALIQALPKQLGIRLERTTRVLDVMVIDHVAKDPTAN